jgi:SecD/SecF fusion protein
MTRRAQWSVLGGVLALLILAGWALLSQPTRLGLDLKGGVELVYEALPTPQSPEVSEEDINDAISTIRRRTDALGVSEPEIQRAGEEQIVVSLPDVQDPERAIEQVGSTAQLFFYDWEGSVIGEPDQPYPAPFGAVEAGQDVEPSAEETDLPPLGAEEKIVERFGGDREKILEYYDRRNDTSPKLYYLFDGDKVALVQSARSCELLAQEWSELQARGERASPPGTEFEGECARELEALGEEAPPAGSEVLSLQQGITIVAAENAEGIGGAPALQSYYLIEDDAALSGRDLVDPEQNVDSQTREPIVTFQFTDQGRRAFQEVTSRLADRGREQILPPGTDRESSFQRFAIVLDNALISRPTIDWRSLPDGIDGRTGAQINGIGSLQAAQDLATQLRIGALPIELRLVSRTQISATLGAEALDESVKAGLFGIGLVALFLLLFYRFMGLVAVSALASYTVFLLALVKLIPITLTLPGVAGLVLTLGVAADANIVMFERVKEERRAGLPPAKAFREGYRKALKTILDANVVTVGVAFILFMLATAGVKGFAFTLGVGVLVSLFTAVLATGAFLGLVAHTRLFRGAPKGKPLRRLNFMGASRAMFTISGGIILAGALAIAAFGVQFGIDFESGTRIQFPAALNIQQTESTLQRLNLKGEVQRLTGDRETLIQVSLPELQPEQVNRLRSALGAQADIPSNSVNVQSIGPTFGAQIARSAFIAIIASLLLLSTYMWSRFGFRYAAPVLIAVGHDLVITTGIYAMFGREVTTATVAALLTILGYSLYDTIIVFDRIRENLPRMTGATVNQVINRSMSEVLVRSLVTSLSTLLPVLALLFLGGETLQDFAFALLVGVLSGAYSSIFIASPLLAFSLERLDTMKARLRRQIQVTGREQPFFDDELEKQLKKANTELSLQTTKKAEQREGADDSTDGNPPPAAFKKDILLQDNKLSEPLSEPEAPSVQEDSRSQQKKQRRAKSGTQRSKKAHGRRR